MIAKNFLTLCKPPLTPAATIKAILAEHLPELKKRYPIEHLALCGSITRDDFNPAESDIDILVEFNGDILWAFFDLEKELENILGRRQKVELVSKRALTSYYWEHMKEDVVNVL